MFCVKCGNEVDDAAVICPKCGVPTTNFKQEAPQAAAQPNIIITNTNTANATAGGFNYIQKSKWTAFFLCLFLGGIGVHRFYVGKTGTGIIYLLTAGLFGVGALIDLIMILIGGFRDKAGQPLK
jgi:hypothetical protein